MRNQFIIIAFICLGMGQLKSQMRFGISDSLNPNAIVQIDTGDGFRKGLLMPRLALKSTNDFYPLGAHVQGMVVYNTSSTGTPPNAVSPGHYYNDGAKWNRILSENDLTSIWLSSQNGKPATNDTQQLYRMGKMALGMTTPTEQLEVAGNIKASNGAANGYTIVKPGAADASGKIQIYNPSNKLLGTIGGDTSSIKYHSNDTLKHHVFTGANIGVNTPTPLVKLEVNGAIKLGNEASTTTAPSAGMIRFNTTTSKFEGYNGTTWLNLHE
jgi:hypothetical protein